ncbi:DUF4345 domain-containing protein [Mycolicibacterium brumae]|uniref:DUF4345 domain-containing protein n=1 Tax=Mycolicibacterium brumae TaxID=85968 RepID=UPI000FF92FE9|nr:DUF4345 domain-containing protein [Mycolicibacterium brumae]MCV7194008.1 DUF4345 domain-containing protein [Mycolicibacterium brumae]RWA19922.1 hypothetical protein MBRU_16015 [Mycolicibacterium brumae DSM 44177]UWW09681.1 DUF4345 domain-containing protein [Mycolicibacterium brumae]
MATAIIIVSAVFFAGMGVVAMVTPDGTMKPFGTVLPQSTARAEIRAVYGGFGLAIAAVLGYAAATPGPVRTGILLTVGAAMAGMAIGRVVSAFIDDRTPFYPNWFYALVEVVIAAPLFFVACG